MSGMSFLKTALGVPGNFVPVLGVINKFLPGDELAPNATPDQVAAAYEQLPPAVQGQIDRELEQELGIKKEETSQLRILAEADMAGSSTRPLIGFTNTATFLPSSMPELIAPRSTATGPTSASRGSSSVIDTSTSPRMAN